MKIPVLRKAILFFLLALLCAYGSAQTGVIKGKVKDPNNDPIGEVVVRVLDYSPETKTRTDAEGNYSLTLPSGRVYRIEFTHVAYQHAILEQEVAIGRIYDRPIKLLSREVADVEIIGEKEPTSIDDRSAMLISPIKMEKVLEMPSVAPSVEAFTKYQPGVATTSEFTSQYQVRGGNYDENLVYVNGIEIYRPFLTRSGQQEGLGFSNPSMASGLKFSTGGFGAEYGDKMSSVLDIDYRRPKDFRATAEVGIISTNLHAEGITKNKKDPAKPGRFTWLMGARRFSMSYFLNSLDTQGDYTPSFLDYQAMFTFTPKSKYYRPRYKIVNGDTTDILYYPNEKLTFTSFFAVTRNRYQFEPTGQETTFGTIQQAFRLRVAFEGREISSYTTGLGAFMVEYKPTTRLQFNGIVTTFQTQESELFDVEGGYLLGEVNTNFGSDEFNETEFDLGIGTQFRHARNYLDALVLSAETNGRWTNNNESTHRLLFGFKYQHQIIHDNLKEYSALDSAGYLVDSTGQFGLDEYIRGDIRLENNLYKAYLQHEWLVSPRLTLLSGARVLYYDQINRWMLSPRVQLLIKAKEETSGETQLRFRLATGLYQQPPFYREFRRLDCTINTDLRAQSSLHAIVGMDYRFYAWNRPFRLFSEAYFKRLYNLIPYEVQNVRIRYYPDQVADGYATGLDIRLNGEFIKGIDSWVSLGLLKTSEDIRGDDQGYIPRPTDQRFTFAMYFQDELPVNPTYKVHVSYVYGSGMRFGPPNNFALRTYYDFPAYHRVDIGFSKLISFISSGERKNRTGVESIWATIEIFNLLQRENTVSYVWIKDLQNRSFAVPNHLSARLLNARIIIKFH
ncbi:MAG: TonB-dependent receptor [Bacteroidia bacterium]